jgi:flavin-dependent dehydrogenase
LVNRVNGIKTDVLVVGGGPAGLAAAIAARQQGLSVTLADHTRPPIDKACGEGLMPEAVAALHHLGVAVSHCDSQAFHGITFVGRECSATARFHGAGGRGLRRVILHQALVRRAEAAGVALCWGSRVAVQGDSITINAERVAARWVIGADGHNSAVRKWAGLDRGRDHGRRFGLRQHFETPPWSDTVEVHWSSHGEAYVTPVAPNQVCVAFLSRERHASVAAAVQHFPELQKRLQHAGPNGVPRGAITCSRTLAAVAKRNVALIGEASGALDAITGQGMELAFRQALALGESLALDDLQYYSAQHHRIMRLPQIMERLMLTMGRHAWLRTPLISAFAAQPWLFDQMLRLHTGNAVPAILSEHPFATDGEVAAA